MCTRLVSMPKRGVLSVSSICSGVQYVVDVVNYCGINPTALFWLVEQKVSCNWYQVPGTGTGTVPGTGTPVAWPRIPGTVQ